MRMTRWYGVLLLVSLLCVVGVFLWLRSDRPPSEEVAWAESAIQGARAVDADRYATEDLEAAVNALADAKEKMKSKDYKAAKALAIAAQEKADVAFTNAETAKREKRIEVEQKMAALQRNWERMKTRAALKPQAEDLEMAMVGIQEQIDQGHYTDAMQQLEEIAVTMDELKARLGSTQRKQEPKQGLIAGTVIFEGTPPKPGIGVAVGADGGIEAMLISLVTPHHRYRTMTDDQGRFILLNVPAGTYAIECWHRALGKLTATVTVPADGKATVNFVYKWWSRG